MKRAAAVLAEGEEAGLHVGAQLHVVHDGTVGLDDPVAAHIPGFAPTTSRSSAPRSSTRTAHAVP